MDPSEIPLRDLHLPVPVGWWPLAPGWWLLAVLAFAGLAWLGLRAFRAWRRARPRRIALAELQRLHRAYAIDGDVARLARDLSALVRRAMLAYAPRQAVAGLTGDAWLGYLDRGLPEPLFSQGPGRELAELPYRRAGQAAELDGETLLDVVRKRLQTPLPEERA